MPKSLFDHLVGAVEQRPRNSDPERRGGVEVDNQLELDRGLDGKLARLLALKDAIGIGCRAPIRIELVNSVGQQAAKFSEESARIDAMRADLSCTDKGGDHRCFKKLSR